MQSAFAIFLVVFSLRLDYVHCQDRTSDVGPYRLEAFDAYLSNGDARRACENRNAWLVEIKDIQIQNAVVSLLRGSRSTWIGAKYDSSMWKWGDGSEFGYSRFADNLGSSSEYPCASIDRDGYWINNGCGNTPKKRYICQSDKNPIVFFSDFELFFDYESKQTFTSASASCSQRAGSILVSVNTSGIQNAIRSQRSYRNYGENVWSGGSDRLQEGEFIWEDGSLISTSNSNWENNAPHTGNNERNCVAIAPNAAGTWADLSCGRAYGYICQRDASSGICAPDNCSNRGSCSVYEDTSNSAKRYLCSCNAGYMGTKCETDRCDPNPCSNGGTCSRASSDPFYNCTCTALYTGSTCSETRFFTNGQCKYHINYLYSTKKNFGDSSDSCKNLGGSLAIVKNATVQKFIVDSAGEVYDTSNDIYLWIGGRFNSTEWQWLDGSRIPSDGEGFQKWRHGAPTGGEGMCAKMTSWWTKRNNPGSVWKDLDWIDKNCTQNHGYVCEVPVGNPCDSTRCVNGTCVKTGCQSRCQCMTGFHGETCENGNFTSLSLQKGGYWPLFSNTDIHLRSHLCRVATAHWDNNTCTFFGLLVV